LKYTTLGRTGIDVSRIALGTMTFGQQNTEADAHRQLDMAVAAGVNFIDTAEMYPFPSTPETWGASERFIGTWMKARGNRDKVVIASKITGPADRFAHVRDGALKLNAHHIAQAVEASLRRLGTDVIDLYQLHWPERPTNFFGQLGYSHVEEDASTPIGETLEALAEQVAAGNIRAVGLSNESPWGMMTFMAQAEAHGLPRVASIQNPYSLLNRTFEIGAAEVAIREDCGLLAYSPLGFGALSGKYLDGPPPAGSRGALFPDFKRNFTDRAVEATADYVALARRHGLDPAQMALAFVNTRRFLTSTIIGATTPEQLETDLASIDLELPGDAIDGIEAIHKRICNPAP